MRKSAPAVILTTLIAVASGSALALGDRAKEKKANTDAAAPASTAPAPSSTYSTPPSASTNGATAAADPRCDESKYASRSAMPKDCLEKQATGSAAQPDKPGLSAGTTSPGGPAGSSSGAASGAAGSASSSSSAGSGK